MVIRECGNSLCSVVCDSVYKARCSDSSCSVKAAKEEQALLSLDSSQTLSTALQCHTRAYSACLSICVSEGSRSLKTATSEAKAIEQR